MKEILEEFSSIIVKQEIIAKDDEPTSYRFKADLTLIDKSHLVAKDYLFPNGRKYSFHWQDKNGNLIIRWNNSMHWGKIKTFPYHKHEKDEVLSSQEVTLEDVLNYVYRILKKEA